MQGWGRLANPFLGGRARLLGLVEGRINRESRKRERNLTTNDANHLFPPFLLQLVHAVKTDTIVLVLIGFVVWFL